MQRALAFGVPLQAIVRIAVIVAVSYQPLVSVKFVGMVSGVVCLVALFSTVRRSNGYIALHDRATGTRVVLKRRVTERR